MKELIENINLSNTLLRILEVGAGVPISNEFFNYSGASKLYIQQNLIIQEKPLIKNLIMM